MSARELASARSFWKRKNIRDGRRSRYVEVEEVSLDSLRADAVENELVDEVVSILATGKEADVYVGRHTSSDSGQKSGQHVYDEIPWRRDQRTPP